MNRLHQNRNNNIGKSTRGLSHDVRTVNSNRLTAVKSDMSGDGFADIIKSIYNGGKSLYQHKDQIANVYSGDIGVAIRNALPDSDDTARPGFAGEKHAILKLSNGKMGVANYMGPGTSLLKRLNRGDPPRTEMDKIAQGHDIRYATAETQADIRKADNIMINKVKATSRNRGDSQINIAQASLMRAKVVGENLGLLKHDAFSGDLSKNKNISDVNKAIMSKKLNQLRQEGYGLNPAGEGHAPGMYGLAQNKNLLPGDVLKMKILRNIKKGSGMNSKIVPVSVGRDLGKSYKLSGSGSNDNIKSFVVKKIIPAIMSSIGVPLKTLATNQVSNLISKALKLAKTGNLSQVVSNLAKTILPIVTMAKIKHVGGVKMSGSGIMKIITPHKSMLLGHLSKGILGAFKYYINKKSVSNGNKKVFGGSGLILAGGSFASFFKGFKKGFTTVFKPASAVLGAVATVAGQPEIGIPLSFISKLL
jgi:hypothetical protein